MGGKLSGLGKALYNPKRKQFLGRDGAAWGKLGVFYFFFYLGLAGFFCAMLAIFMALTPRDHPRYILDDSRMRTRSNPLSPGLGFRPQPEVDKNVILINKKKSGDGVNPYATSLDQYLRVYYSSNDHQDRQENEDNYGDAQAEKGPDTKKFIIQNPGDCRNQTQYGFQKGQPCILVKMNKIVDFIPEPLPEPRRKDGEPPVCPPKPDAIPVHCYGEYPADGDNIGPITYISENGRDFKCGSLGTKWFPYQGKQNRKDYYQAPYVWVQFNAPKPNVLINVLCRVYGQNIDFDKKAGRALTRFQLYVEDLDQPSSSRRSGEM
jgi:sodium/potassium-transporting ATPase subunit beta